MHLPKILYLTFTLGTWSQETLPIMWPMHEHSLKLLRPTVKEKMISQDVMLFDPWPRPWGQGHTNIAQYPLHHVFYPSTKFEFATSNGIRGDANTRNTLFGVWPCGYGHTNRCSLQYVLCICKVWSWYVLCNCKNLTDQPKLGRWDECADRQTMDEFWFEINRPPFSEENACIIRQQPMVHHPKYPRFSLTKRCILWIIHYLTLTLDKVTRIQITSCDQWTC